MNPRLFAAIFAAAVIVIVALGFILPANLQGLLPNPSPSASYKEAAARIERQQNADERVAAPGGMTIFMTHGARTPRVVVLLHGFTNSPRQFEEFGARLYAAGDNVYIPRLPQHGELHGRASLLADLTAEKLRDAADSAVDVAVGLGDSVIVAGLSAGGTMAAWIAQYRPDVHRVVMIAPLLELSRIPRILADPVMNILLRVPNMTWNQPADLTEPDREPGVATGAIAQLLRLGSAVRHAARNETPKCRDIVFLTNAHDRTVSTAPVLELARTWSNYGVKVEVYQLADSLKLRHDVIDPRQKWAQPNLVYPVLEALVHGERVPTPAGHVLWPKR
jgi:esterase/lipase